jgi:hypothetical protein
VGPAWQRLATRSVPRNLHSRLTRRRRGRKPPLTELDINRTG